MIKRILDARASDFRKMKGKDLVNSIQISEGRTIISEVIGICTPLFDGISNPELAASFGADIILLNLYDVDSPVIKGLPIGEDKKVITELKRLIGRPIGINLEPVDRLVSQ